MNFIYIYIYIYIGKKIKKIEQEPFPLTLRNTNLQAHKQTMSFDIKSQDRILLFAEGKINVKYTRKRHNLNIIQRKYVSLLNNKIEKFVMKQTQIPHLLQSHKWIQTNKKPVVHIQ